MLEECQLFQIAWQEMPAMNDLWVHVIPNEETVLH